MSFTIIYYVYVTFVKAVYALFVSKFDFHYVGQDAKSKLQSWLA